MKLLGLACAFTLVLVIQGTAWIQSEGKCYTVLPDVGDFLHSKSLCRNSDAYPVEPRGTLELNFLYTNVIPDVNGHYWVGLKYNQSTARYTFNRMTEIRGNTYLESNGPNSTACMKMIKGHSLQANSRTSLTFANELCDNNSLRIICEKNANLATSYVFDNTQVDERSGYCKYKTEMDLDWNACKFVCIAHRECTSILWDGNTNPEECYLHTFKEICRYPRPTNQFIKKFRISPIC